MSSCDASWFYKDVQGNRIPNKVLRHFSLIPQIKHMFKCKEIATLMSWYAENKSTNNTMRVPVGRLDWKHIDSKWHVFEREP